ncbi:hypothetical protein A2U01_0073226, partial [Trifolium medium]|nr:hypothetical protein [Trifolium medium]
MTTYTDTDAALADAEADLTGFAKVSDVVDDVVAEIVVDVVADAAVASLTRSPM